MAEDHSRQVHEDKKNRRKKQIRRRVSTLIALLLLAAAGTALYVKYGPTWKHIEPKAYFERLMSGEGEAVTLAEDERAVVLGAQVSGKKALIYKEALYLDYDMVRRNICSRFFWDEQNQNMLYTSATETSVFPVNSETYTVGDKEETFSHPVVLSEERGLFLSAKFLQKFANVEYVQGEDGFHVLVRCQWGDQLMARVERASAVRFRGGVKGLIVTRAKKGDEVAVLEQFDSWSRVLTEDGFIGYLPNRSLGEAETKRVERAFEEPVYPSLAGEEPVNLIWHQIGNEDSNGYLKQDTKEMTGVNVISPTWFALSDNEGNFTSYASKKYVKQAHKKGLKVWGLVSNFSPDMSTQVLVASTKARTTLAQNLVDAALECGMDGINVDLEAITEEAGWGYVQFMRELSILTHANNLVLSVDVPMPFDFNLHYDRAELGRVADYVILMGYDEHYVGSQAGSVASLPFEENGIARTLEDIPASKVISGIPFYTRIWYSQTEENGDEKVWSEILGMNAVTKTLESYSVTPVWDEDTMQNYAEWTVDDGIVCRIWVEDEESIAKKAELVGKYGLGGIAAWALGSERNTVWDIIYKAVFPQGEDGQDKGHYG